MCVGVCVEGRGWGGWVEASRRGRNNQGKATTKGVEDGAWQCIAATRSLNGPCLVQSRLADTTQPSPRAHPPPCCPGWQGTRRTGQTGSRPQAPPRGCRTSCSQSPCLCVCGGGRVRGVFSGQTRSSVQRHTTGDAWVQPYWPADDRPAGRLAPAEAPDSDERAVVAGRPGAHLAARRTRRARRRGPSWRCAASPRSRPAVDAAR